MYRIQLFFIFVISFVFFLSMAQADKVILKTGEVHEGKILSQDDYSVTIKTGNLPQRFYLEQIERVEKDEDKLVEEGIDYLAIEPQTLEAIDEKKKELIEQLLVANGTKESMAKEMQLIIANAPEDRQEELRELLNVDEIMQRLIPVYDKYYTEFELIELIRFFESPVAKKVFEVTPQLMQESLRVSIEYFMEKANPPK